MWVAGCLGPRGVLWVAGCLGPRGVRLVVRRDLASPCRVSWPLRGQDSASLLLAALRLAARHEDAALTCGHRFVAARVEQVTTGSGSVEVAFRSQNESSRRRNRVLRHRDFVAGDRDMSSGHRDIVCSDRDMSSGHRDIVCSDRDMSPRLRGVARRPATTRSQLRSVAARRHPADEPTTRSQVASEAKKSGGVAAAKRPRHATRRSQVAPHHQPHAPRAQAPRHPVSYTHLTLPTSDLV